jgi:hypothetical protein
MHSHAKGRQKGVGWICNPDQIVDPTDRFWSQRAGAQKESGTMFWPSDDLTETYWTVVLEPGFTKWQSPSAKTTRGAFKTHKEARAWARENVPGQSFTVLMVKGI